MANLYKQVYGGDGEMRCLFFITIQPVLGTFLEWYGILFILGIITLAFTILLRSWLLFLGQLIIVSTSMIVSNITISFILMILQILFTIYLLYRMKQAIDYNYVLVLEKTHQTPRKITSDRDTGTKFTF